jgi:DNA-binding transcriptional LysR family regulator
MRDSSIHLVGDELHTRVTRFRKPTEMKGPHTATVPDLRRFSAFVAVAEELHFGRAARRLMMCQSPLSRLIMALEEDTGITLFFRNRHHVRLTEAGQSMLVDARNLLAIADQAIRKAREINTVDP